MTTLGMYGRKVSAGHQSVNMSIEVQRSDIQNSAEWRFQQSPFADSFIRNFASKS
jgi:hypothetical protein